ncbi:MAG: hypothetical protein PHH14_01305 [Candidatus Margulisbacteria bacterium]|nr:hypothetical protein [Candidatus Margulisiibacteriota bacterium]
MKNKKLFLAILGGLILIAGTALSAVPEKIAYEGRLTDSASSPVTSTKTVTFSIYDADTAGTLLWGPESHEITPDSQGVFSVLLGSTTALSESVFSSSARYIEITVGGETITPRTQIVTVGYAFKAASADSVGDASITTAKLADSSVTDAKIVTVSGSKVIGTILPGPHSTSHMTGGSDPVTVEAGMISNEAVTAAKLASDAVETAKIKDLNITTTKLAATSVTAAKLGSDVAGTGLTGGNGSALAVDTGTTANKIVQLDANAKLPAVDGSALTNITATDSTKVLKAGDTMTGTLTAESNLLVTGNVGIGTNDPAGKLHVYDNVDGPMGIEIENINNGSSATNGAFLNFANSTGINGTLAVFGNNHPASYLRNRLILMGFDDYGGTSTGIGIAADQAGTDIRFYTSGWAEKMRIATALTNVYGPISVSGTIETTSGGVKFPDGTIQTTAATGTGTVTEIATGTGLTGGPITSTGTISIDAGGVGTTQLAATSVTAAKLGSDVAGTGLTGGNGSALAVDSGTTANKILKLDADAKIPAVDGSLLTNINATIADGAITTAKITDEAVTSAKVNFNYAASASKGGAASSVAAGAAVLSFASTEAARLTGNVDLKPGSNVTITQTGQTLEVSSTSTGGTVTSVATGTGLTGGPITSTGTISIDAGGVSTTQLAATSVTAAKLGSDVAGTGLTGGNGSALAVDVGTTANKIVQLDADAKLPAIDGSALTNITATDSTKVLKTGDTMTGRLTLDATGLYIGSDTNLYRSATGLKIIGGSEITNTLSLQGTSGNGTATSAAIQFLTGNNGETTAGSILNNGNILFGSGTKLALSGENYGIQVVSDGVNAGSVFGTDDNTRVGFFDLLSGTKFWHFSNRGSSGSNRLGIYNYNGTSYSSELLTFLTSGNIGVGTTSPAQKLSVAGTIEITSGSGGGLKFADGTIQTSAGGSGTVTSVATGTGLTGGPITGTGTISIDAGGVTATQLATDAVETAKIKDANVTSAKLASDININTTGTVTAAAFSGDGSALSNVTATDSTKVLKAGDTMTGTLELPANGLIVNASDLIVKDGKIGVGTSEPSYIIDVSGTGLNGAHAIRIKNTSSTGNQSAEFRAENNLGYSARMFKIGSGYGTWKTLAANDIGFYNANAGNISILNDVAAGKILLTAGGASSAHVTINANGNVGIGTTSPAQKLSVAGTIEITSGSGGGLKFTDGTIQTSAGGSGTVTSVATGTGLTGGPITGTGTISIDAGGVGTDQLAATSVTAAKLGSDVAGTGLTGGNGSALAVDTGTTANKIVKLDTDAKLPAVDGSALTNVTGTDSTKVLKAGDTMTGTLELPASGLIVNTSDLIVKDGKVGIGTAEPQTELDVNGTVKGTKLRVGADVSGYENYPLTISSADGGIILNRTSTANTFLLMKNTNAYTILRQNGKEGVSLEDFTPLAAGVGGSVAFTGYYTDTSNTIGAKIKMLKDNATSGDYSFGLGFYTRTNGSVLTERVRLSSSGAQFEGIGNGLTFIRQGSGTRGFSQDFAGSNYGQFFWGTGVYFNSGAANPVGETYNVPAGELWVDGKVGIGTTEPSAKLTVTGTIETIGTGGIKFSDGTTQTTAASGTGTVTSVATGTGLTGGPITGTGTISIDAGGVTATQLATDAVETAKIKDANVTSAKLASDIQINTTGTVTAAAFSGDGSALENVTATDSTKVLKAGDTMTGTLTAESNLLVTGNVGIGTMEPAAQLQVSPATATTVGIYVQSASGQSAQLQRWIGNGGSAYVSSNGLISAPGFNPDVGLSRQYMSFNSLQYGTSGLISWCNTSAYNGTKDIGISRYAAGKLAIGSGTQGNYTGTLLVGEVGIGTTEPASTLTVAGTIETTLGGVKFPDGNIQTTAYTGNAGTVTSVSTGTGLTGGPITGTGTISIDAGGVTATQLATDAVETAKIKDAAVTSAKLASDISINTTGTVTAAAFSGDGSALSNVTATDSTKVLKAGDTMTGTLTAESNLLVTGNVGIGTNDPAGKLHVYDNVDGPMGIEIENINNGSSATNGAFLNFANSTGINGTLAVFGNNHPASYLRNRLILMGFDDYGGTSTGIGIAADQAGTDIRFYTSGWAEKMRIATALTNVYGPISVSGTIETTLGGVKFPDGNIQTTAYTGNAGTVTSVSTGTGLTGGPITSTGTISIDAGGVTATLLASDAVETAKIKDAAVTGAKLATDINIETTGTVTAAAFSGDGSALSNVTATDSTKVLKTGDRIGWLDISSTTADATAKYAPLISRQYSNANGYWSLIRGSALVGLNIIEFGGGTASYDSATHIRFYTGYAVNTATGAIRMTINNTGNVGIGSTEPASKLTVAGTIETTLGGVKFPDGTTQTTAASGSGTVTSVATGTGLTGGPITETGTISIDAGGVTETQLADNAVTTAKISNEAVTGDKLSSNINYTGSIISNINSFQIYGSAAQNILYLDDYVNTSQGSFLNLRKARGVYASPTTVNNGDEINRIGYYPRVSSGWTGYMSAFILGKINGTVTSTAAPTDLIYYTGTGASVATERMRIRATGNIGIASSEPGSLLTVAGTIETTLGGVKFPDGNIQTTAYTGNTGTVTSVATGTGLTGGPITGTGTISIDAGGVTATQLATDAVETAKIKDAAVTSAKLASNIQINTTGTVTAAAFSGNGAALTNVTATDSTKVLKAGDTMTGQLTITKSTFPVLQITRSLTSYSTPNIKVGAANLEVTNTTPAAGTGPAFYFKAPDSAGNSTYAGLFGGALSTITDGSEVGEIVFQTGWHGGSIDGTKPMLKIISTSSTTGNVLVPNGKLGIGSSEPNSLLTVAGTIETTLGGVKFPDGTIQTSASTATSSNVVIRNLTPVGSGESSTAGTQWEIAADANYIYICTTGGPAGTAVWKRISLSDY